MSSELILHADGIGRRAADGTWLLKGVSLEVRAGERWAVTGPTGSGKTLLLRALALLDEVDEGRILWRDEPIPADRVPRFRRDVIYLHQRPVLVDGDVEANLRLPFDLKQAESSAFDKAQILRMLERLGRSDAFLGRESDELSGGEANIVSLLRAVQLQPSLLLLDEPTAALDAESTRAVETLVAHHLQQSEGRAATVWVGHDPGQIGRVADQLLHLEGGEVTEAGDVR